MSTLRRLLRSSALKRGMDLAGAVVGLHVATPILVVVGGVSLATQGRPIFFRQTRLGRHNRPFPLIKLRTMSDHADKSGRPLPDEQRLTRWGRWLRKVSLDELPELINVLRGEMSLVGPRPLLAEYRERYTPEQARRHEVKPGITGWAQINGRNLLDWAQKFELDVWYVDNWNLLLDLKILCATPFVVLGRQGVSQPGHNTADVFQSN